MSVSVRVMGSQGERETQAGGGGEERTCRHPAVLLSEREASADISEANAYERRRTRQNTDRFAATAGGRGRPKADKQKIC